MNDSGHCPGESQRVSHIQFDFMVLKAVFLEFNGVVLRDKGLQQQLIDDILLAENLRPDPKEFAEWCLGYCDRTCLERLLNRRGRVPSQAYLDQLLAKKSAAYIQALSQHQSLPLYPGLHDLLYQLKTLSLPLGLVTAAQRTDVDWVLAQGQLIDHFTVMITRDDLDCQDTTHLDHRYPLAIARMQACLPDEAIAPENCLAIEASFAGIAAAQRARVPVVGVAHLYPYRMMQRRADWAVDYLNDIDLDWIQQRYSSQLFATGGV